MASVVKSIGTTVRDYSTITLWEADLDVTPLYASGDDAIGELYNDSNFNESFTLNGGATVGLVSKSLSPAAGHGHNGTIGTGVRMVCSTGRNWLLNTTSIWLEGIEFNCNGFGNSAVATQLQVGSGSTSALPGVFSRLIVHDCAISINTSASRQFVGLIGGYGTLQNSIIYNWLVTNTSSGIGFGLIADVSTTVQRFYNTTVHGITRNGGSGNVIGVQTGTSNHCRNVISTVSGGTTTSVTKRAIFHPGTGTKTHNLSDDAGSTNQTSSITFAVVADLYISTVGGAEDLRLKAGAPAIDVGVALGIASQIYLDIEGQDRDVQGGVAWDIGADEWVSSGTPQDADLSLATLTWVVPGFTASLPVDQAATLTLALSTWSVPGFTASLPAGADDLILRSQLGLPFFWMRGGVISDTDLLTDPDVKDFLLGLYAGPLEAISVVPLSVKVGGVWKEAVAHVKVSGAWKSASIKTKVGGVWK